MRKISVRGGKKQLCPRPPKDGRLSCGRGPRLGCVRGHREKAVCLPASGRARSACRAVCAVRALRRASPPSSGGQARVVKGVQSSSVSIGGRARAFWRSDRRHGRRFGRNPAHRPKPDSIPARTQKFVYKKAPAPDHRRAIGRFPTPKRPAERPEMGYGVPRSVRYGSIVPSLTA